MWTNVAVATDATDGGGGGPVVRMLTTATERRGCLPKRMRSFQTFRSVLSMDIEHRGYMPNLKISARNTLQVTGAQDMEVLGDILHFLCTTYAGRGITVTNAATAGFVGDVVLANVHFRLNFRVDRSKLRDRIIAERGAFIASYEPLVRDVSVSLKYADASPLPHNGAVYPRWHLDTNRERLVSFPARPIHRSLDANQWATVTLAEARCLVPHINLKTNCPRITSLRVFQSGSVIIVSRWPAEMKHVYARFQESMRCIRKRVLDPEYARQRTITECWGME